MKYTEMCGHKVSHLGMGCMRLPSENDYINFPEAEKVIDLCMESGINYYDTAYMYHRGESESFLREALVKRYDRDKFFLVDKLPPWVMKTAEDAEKIFNEQLKRCGTDYFDFYLIHSLSAELWERSKNFGLIEFVEKKKREGYIKHIGFSFHDSPEVLRTIVDEESIDWEFAQVQINYYDWTTRVRSKELYEILEENSIPCVAMEPVRGGMLANPLPEIKTLLDECGIPPVELALRFAGGLPGVNIVLSGMSTEAQIKENIKLFSNFEPLSKEQLSILESVTQKLAELDLVPCTSCRYCADCPAGVSIPEIFSAFNDAKKFNVPGHLIWHLEEMIGPAKRVQNCTECGACSAACPQHIEIPDTLRFVEKEYQKLKV